MKKMTNLEAIAVLDSMKVKIDIPNAAVTQRKRNEVLEMAIRSLTNDECVDAIMNEVCKKISVPVQSGYPVLPKVVLEETLHLGKPGDVETIPMYSFTQRHFDPFSVVKFDAGEERRRRKENPE
jgi:hypothetical protein